MIYGHFFRDGSTPNTLAVVKIFSDAKYQTELYMAMLYIL